MVRALTVPLKRLIYHHLVVLRRSAEDVLAALFFGDPTQCSLDHLKRIASMCRRNYAAAFAVGSSDVRTRSYGQVGPKNETCRFSRRPAAA